MRALLDVNVLIALLDQDHASHLRARDWFRAHARAGWSSCPITQNGCVRVMSNASYPNPLPAGHVCARLRDAAAHRFHQFWSDEISLLDDRIFDAARIHGSRQITDLYLLALAVRRQGTLVTFDGSIAISAVHGAASANLTVL
jgi:toxin-antitoxin system PIN domain toxin